MALSKDQILAAPLPAPMVLHVPEWSGDVYIRIMTGTERDAFEAAVLGTDGKVTKDNLRARLLTRTLADETGARLFADGDAAALGGQSAVVLDRLYAEAMSLNGFTKSDVDELAKN